MNVPVLAALLILGLFGGMLLLLETGRRLALARRAKNPEAGGPGLGAVEGAMFGLMGLLIAFTFSGAAGRFDARRHLIVEEANAIGTAYLRLDLLPAAAQPALREHFRRYVDARLAVYRAPPDLPAARAELDRAAALQREIWSQSVAASQATSRTAATMLLLPALNAMIDITTTRTMAARMHVPPLVFALLGVVASLPSEPATLRERISDLEKVESPEVSVERIEPPDAVLPQQGREVGVGNEVAADGKVGGHLPVDLEEPVPLREHAHTRQAEEGLHVAEGLAGRERLGEGPRVRRDTQERYERGPGDVEKVGIGGALLQKADRPRMPWARASPVAGAFQLRVDLPGEVRPDSEATDVGAQGQGPLAVPGLRSWLWCSRSLILIRTSRGLRTGARPGSFV